MLALLLGLTGCTGQNPREKNLIPPETQGTSDITVMRGIASEGTLFVTLDKQVSVCCTVGWKVSGGKVTETDVLMLLETFRMAMQDAMDGLSTEEAWAADMEAFVSETAENTASALSDTDISVTVESLNVERIENP